MNWPMRQRSHFVSVKGKWQPKKKKGGGYLILLKRKNVYNSAPAEQVRRLFKVINWLEDPQIISKDLKQRLQKQALQKVRAQLAFVRALLGMYLSLLLSLKNTWLEISLENSYFCCLQTKNAIVEISCWLCVYLHYIWTIWKKTALIINLKSCFVIQTFMIRSLFPLVYSHQAFEVVGDLHLEFLVLPYLYCYTGYFLLLWRFFCVRHLCRVDGLGGFCFLFFGGCQKWSIGERSLWKWQVQ